MRAILLSAGFGTRLHPLTLTTPKCLVQVRGRPLLGIWLDMLRKSGVNKFLVNTHYLADKVRGFIRESQFMNDVTLIDEEVLLGTAGTLVKNIDFFENEDGLLIHADNYCQADFKEFICAHKVRPGECLLTMMVFRTPTPKECGIVEIDENNIVRNFQEKVDNPKGNLANGAIYIISKELQQLLRDEFSGASDFSTEVLPKLIGKIYVHVTNDTFIDIGTPEAYKKANRY